LDDSSGVFSARQANLFDGEIAEDSARARVYRDRNDAVWIGDRRCSKNAIEIDLHGLSRGPAGAERPKSVISIGVDDIVSYTHESLPGTHRCAFRTATAPRQRAMRERRGRWMNIQRSHVDNAVDLHGPDRGHPHGFILWLGKRHPDKRGDALLRERFILLFDRFIWTRECQQRQEETD